MIKKIIREIKDAENQSDERISQVKEQEYVRLKEFRITGEKEWEKVNENISNLEEEIISKYKSQARKELRNIEEEAQKTLSVLKQVSSHKDLIVDSIVKNLLKEKK